MTARETLDHALVDMAERGQRPRCAEPEEGGSPWVSDDRDDRARAAALCHGCAVFTECGATADETDERWHVWGGTDRTKQPRKTTTSTKENHG